MNVPLLLDKEAVAHLVFDKYPKSNPCESLMDDLRRAQILGNLYKFKVEIVFTDTNQKLYKVKTTVWDFSHDYVSIKGGVMIPVNSIIRVNF